MADVFFQTGSSYISAVNVSTKFGLQIDFDLKKTSDIVKYETVGSTALPRRHLEKR